MNPFTFAAVDDVAGALWLAGEGTSFIAGGTNLIDLMKVDVVRPSRLVYINRLGLDTIERTPDGGLRMGALVRNAATASHPLVREHYPLLASAILSGATAQIRNMASNGGNLLQRTRCCYFYDIATPCNKREPGSGCPAAGGLARQHAILGASAHCIATHPSDMCVALAALEATVHVASPRGERVIPFAEFHRLPGDRPDLDTTLARDELVVALTLPSADRFRAHGVYLKLRERRSYAFALVSVAAALDLDGGAIRAARLALGGVAHKPWRDPAAEALLVGHQPNEQAFGRTADALLAGAMPQGAGEEGSNAFKIPLARRAVVRALAVAATGTVNNHGGEAP
jgi:xanthine dehydrogenase YagS FAD-binding subunit